MDKISDYEELEITLSYLEEDIKNLQYINEEYFLTPNPSSLFPFQYYELQNALSQLWKCMRFNREQIQEYLKNDA